MKLYREVKASERLPDKDGSRYSISVTAYHIAGGVVLVIYDFDDNRWLKDHNGESIVVYKWLEPIETTEEEIAAFISEAYSVWADDYSDNFGFTDLAATAILSKLKGE